MQEANDIVWFEFVESRVFFKQVRELAPEVLTNIQSDLVQNPRRGDIVKGHMAFERRELLIPVRHEAKAVATVICISTSSTPAEFTCQIYLVRVTKRIYHRIRRGLLAN